VTLLISKLGMLPIMNFASEEIKHQYLPRIANGEIQASYCLSEADAGSDVAAMRCRAVRDGDDYILNGSKYWITNVGVSETYTVFASTNQEARSHGITASWWRRTGVSNSPSTRTNSAYAPRPLAKWSLTTCACREPPYRAEGEGFKIAMHTLDRSRPTIGAQAVGSLRRPLTTRPST